MKFTQPGSGTLESEGDSGAFAHNTGSRIIRGGGGVIRICDAKEFVDLGESVAQADLVADIFFRSAATGDSILAFFALDKIHAGFARVSLPIPPSRRSLPAPPRMQSSPAPPSNALFPLLWMEEDFGWNRWQAYDLLTHVVRLTIGYYGIGTVGESDSRARTSICESRTSSGTSMVPSPNLL